MVFIQRLSILVWWYAWQSRGFVKTYLYIQLGHLNQCLLYVNISNLSMSLPILYILIRTKVSHSLGAGHSSNIWSRVDNAVCWHLIFL